VAKFNGQEGQQTSKTRTGIAKMVNSVKVRLHVATTWFELPCCPLVYVLDSLERPDGLRGRGVVVEVVWDGTQVLAVDCWD
jgi:hypothetical protein